MVELTAEFLHVADGCDASGLKDGRSQRPLYQMNSTKAVPDVDSKNTPTPSYKRPVASKEINLPTFPTCFERQKLASLPLRAPNCLNLNEHAEIPERGAKETVMRGNDQGRSTFLQPRTADASEHITKWIQCKVSVFLLYFLLAVFSVCAACLSDFTFFSPLSPPCCVCCAKGISLMLDYGNPTE